MKHTTEKPEKDAFELMQEDEAVETLRKQEEKLRLAELEREKERAMEQKERDEAELERVMDNKVPFYG